MEVAPFFASPDPNVCVQSGRNENNYLYDIMLFFGLNQCIAYFCVYVEMNAIIIAYAGNSSSKVKMIVNHC